MDKTEVKKSGPSRLQWKINHYIGLGLILLIFVAVNYIGGKQYFRENLASSGYTKISELSINMLSNLNEPVEIINLFSPQEDLLSGLIVSDVVSLLDEYKHYGGKQFKLTQINAYIEPELANEALDKYKIAFEESLLIIVKGDQHRILSYSELAEISPGGGPYDPVPPRVLAFRAEQEITSVIQELTDPEKAVMYFLMGHGEYDITSELQDRRGLSRLADAIARQNIELKKVNLIEEGQVPDDADMIVIAGPRTPYLDQEIAMLKSYIQREDDKAGRMLVMLDPQTETGLEELLADRGVVFRNDLTMVQFLEKGLVNRMEDAIIASVANHPVTSWMQGRQIYMGLGKSRSLQILSETSAGAVPVAIPLLMTPKEYWGETEPDQEDARPTEGVDVSGPLTVGVLIDEGSLSGGQVNLQADRIIAIGSAAFLTNQTLQGNQVDLFLNICNWMLDKENKLGISPKIPEEYNLALNEKQYQMLFNILVLGIPSLGLIVGFFVWLRRKQ
ncbi:MAG: GldG family protein [Verrucomicrobiota bacterium]